MLARLSLLLLLSLAAACATRQPPRMIADPARYEVRDTAAYENVLSGGMYGLLLRNGVVIDSVDLFFGVHRLNNGSVVFLPVEPSPFEELPDGMEIADHVVFDGHRRVLLNSYLPHFSDYFSSPNVIDGILYYWGLEHLADGEYRIHAQRYDAITRRVQSIFLIQADVRTDDRAYFDPPHEANGLILYRMFQHCFHVDPLLTVVHHGP